MAGWIVNSSTVATEIEIVTRSGRRVETVTLEANSSYKLRPGTYWLTIVEDTGTSPPTTRQVLANGTNYIIIN